MENQDYRAAVGSDAAPYLTQLAARCGTATNYHAVGHPSLPNYVAATSGTQWPALDRFRSDCDPSRRCSTAAESIFSQAPSWRAYEESMPGPCERSDAGEYAARHNPPLYYRSLAGCATNDVPMTQLSGDLADGRLPAFSFITPNLCDDEHDCPVAKGDAWLSRMVPSLVDSPAYSQGHTVIFITYDEGTGDVPAVCEGHPSAPGCRVATVVVSPTTPPGTQSAESFDHYSLLRTTEELLGLPYLGAAANAPSMSQAFGLTAAPGAAGG